MGSVSRAPNKAFIQTHQHCDSVSNGPALVEESREEGASSGKDALSARGWQWEALLHPSRALAVRPALCRMVLRTLQSLHSQLSFFLMKLNTGVRRYTNVLVGTDPRGHEPCFRNTYQSSHLPAPRRSPRLQLTTVAQNPGAPRPHPIPSLSEPRRKYPADPNNKDFCDADGGWGQFTTNETLWRVGYQTT